MCMHVALPVPVVNASQKDAAPDERLTYASSINFPYTCKKSLSVIVSKGLGRENRSYDLELGFLIIITFNLWLRKLFTSTFTDLNWYSMLGAQADAARSPDSTSHASDEELNSTGPHPVTVGEIPEQSCKSFPNEFI